MSNSLHIAPLTFLHVCLRAHTIFQWTVTRKRGCKSAPVLGSPKNMSRTTSVWVPANSTMNLAAQPVRRPCQPNSLAQNDLLTIAALCRHAKQRSFTPLISLRASTASASLSREQSPSLASGNRQAFEPCWERSAQSSAYHLKDLQD